MKKLRQNKNFRKLVWSILVLVLTYIAQELTSIPREFAPLLVLIINEITKYINVELLGDIWVIKPKPEKMESETEQ